MNKYAIVFCICMILFIILVPILIYFDIYITNNNKNYLLNYFYLLNFITFIILIVGLASGVNG